MKLPEYRTERTERGTTRDERTPLCRTGSVGRVGVRAEPYGATNEAGLRVLLEKETEG